MAGSRRSWTDEQLLGAVSSSASMAQALVRLGPRPAGGNYAQVRHRIAVLGLDTGHWTGQAHLKGKRNPSVRKMPLEQILVPGSSYQSAKLRKRLMAEGRLEARCSACGLTKWQRMPIPLELDHIDGDRTNNMVENLRLICPNCHAHTPTYRGKNARYAHIPPLQEVTAAVMRLGSVTAYARERGVTPDTVRGWLRSDRLRMMEGSREKGGSRPAR